jgi:hypothetical protein
VPILPSLRTDSDVSLIRTRAGASARRRPSRCVTSSQTSRNEDYRDPGAGLRLDDTLMERLIRIVSLLRVASHWDMEMESVESRRIAIDILIIVAQRPGINPFPFSWQRVASGQPRPAFSCRLSLASGHLRSCPTPIRDAVEGV